MTAIARSTVSIYIAEAATDPSAIVATDLISGEIKSYAKSGGDRDVESDPVFGGFVDKEKPQSQVEMAMEIIPKVNENQNIWDAMAYTLDDAGVYTMASVVSGTSTLPTKKSIFITATDGTNYKTLCYNNCDVTVLDLEHNADDNRTSNITFKFSPTDDSGVSNFMTAATDLASLPAWTALDNN